MDATHDRPTPKARRRPDRRSSDRSRPCSQDIARRAYEMFLERGSEHGRDLEDWLRAEVEFANGAAS